jgi:DNA-directed RNA polymerase subunit delta
MAENKSFVDEAYDVLAADYKKKGKPVPMAFNELMMAVGQKRGITKEEELLKMVSRFYTSLTMDGRFVIKENNTWVLREHEKFENVHIDMNDVYSDDDDDDDDDSVSKTKEKDDDEDEEEKDDENPVKAETEEEEE